jgi:prolyl-tRNA editing enzyme YbaK/EbsC (Cys-tRNA(Pro) deacylase)
MLNDEPNIKKRETSYERLVDFIKASGEPFRLLEHPPCRTSIESSAARALAGAPGSIGAKALILRTSSPTSFAMAVLPGNHRLSNERLRVLIGRFRFALQDEIEAVTSGLQPGMIPPFARPVFPRLSRLMVHVAVSKIGLIGFNAAHFQRSIVMSGASYMRLVPDAEVMDITDAVAESSG